MQCLLIGSRKTGTVEALKAMAKSGPDKQKHTTFSSLFLGLAMIDRDLLFYHESRNYIKVKI